MIIASCLINIKHADYRQRCCPYTTKIDPRCVLNEVTVKLIFKEGFKPDPVFLGHPDPDPLYAQKKLSWYLYKNV